MKPKGDVGTQESDNEKTAKLKVLRTRVIELYYNLVEQTGQRRIPEYAKHHIEYIIFTCSRLLGSSSHQDTVYQFLNIMEEGLKEHVNFAVKVEKEGDVWDTHFNIVALSTALALALKDAVDAGGLHMEKLSELYTPTSYYKPIASMKQMVQDVYSVLRDDKRKLRTFLNISKDENIQVSLYYYNIKHRPKDVFITSIDVPSPSFFDAEKSFHYILHEVAHFLHTNSLEAAKKCFLEITLSYLTVCIFSDIVDEEEQKSAVKVSPRRTKLTFGNIFKTLEESKSIRKVLKKLSDDTRMPTFVDELGKSLINAEIEFANPTSEAELEILKALRWFNDRNLSMIWSRLYQIFLEAEADVLMCEMADEDFTLTSYIKFWEKHFESFGMRMMENDHPFIYRICIVIQYFIEKRNGKLEDIQGFGFIADNNILEYYHAWKPVWYPFVKYTEKWMYRDGESEIFFVERENGISLHRMLKREMGIELSPGKLSEVNEQIAFHANNWFRWLLNTADEISKI